MGVLRKIITGDTEESIRFDLFVDEDGHEYRLPFCGEGYSHISFLPSECDRYIKYLEEYKDNFTDDEISKFNKDMLDAANREYTHIPSGSSKKSDVEILTDYFNFDEFDDQEYNGYLNIFKNYKNGEIYDVNTILKEGIVDLGSSEGKSFIILFFESGKISKISYSSNILSYIGSHSNYGDSVFIKECPLKYIPDIIFELKFLNGLLLEEGKISSINKPQLKNMKFGYLDAAKKAYQIKYGLSKKSSIWQGASVITHLKFNSGYREVIVKPELDQYLKTELTKKE